MLELVHLDLPLKMVYRESPALKMITKRDSKLKAHEEANTITLIWEGSHASWGDNPKDQGQSRYQHRISREYCIV